MTAQEWLDLALSGTTVVDVGQLDKEARKLLDRAVKTAQLMRWREPWLGCLGRERFHWARA